MDSFALFPPFISGMFNALSAHIAVLDSNGTIVAVNDAWRRFGDENDLRMPDSGRGRNYLALCEAVTDATQPEAAQVARAIRDLLAGRSHEAHIEYPCHSTTEQRWFVAHLVAVEDNGQRWVLTIHENITQRKLAEIAQQHSEERFVKAFHANPSAMSITRIRDGKTLDINDSFLRLLGYEREEFIGRSGLELNVIGDPAERKLIVGRLLNHETIQNYETVVYTKAGEGRHVLVSLETVELDQQPCILAILTDVTERKQYEEQIRYQASLLEHVSDAIIATDLSFNITFWNAAAEQVYGWRATEVLGRNATEILQSTYTDQDPQAVRQQFLTQGVWNGELTQKRKDGTSVAIMSSAALLRGKNHQPTGAVAVNRDITDRKQAELAWQSQSQLQDQLTKITATVPGMICSFQLHPNGTVAMPFASAALDDIYGLTHDRIVHDASPIFELMHPDDVPYVNQTIAESARTMSMWHAEYRFQHPRKGERWLEGRSMPQREPDGSLLWHGFIHDVTERKRAEEALQASEARYRTLTEQLPAIVYVEDATSPEGTVTYISPQVSSILGVLAEDWLRDDLDVWREHVHPEDREWVSAKYQTCFQDQTTFDAEYRMITPDLRLVWIHDQARVVYDATSQKRLIRGVMYDITARKEAELSIQQRNEELRLLHEASQRLNRSLDPNEVYQTVHDFIANVLPMDSLVLSSFDEETQLITCTAFWTKEGRLDVSHFPPIPLEPEGQGTQSIAIRTGKALLLNDYMAHMQTAQSKYYVDDRSAELTTDISNEADTTRSALVVPLKVSGRVRGVIQVLSYQHNAYTPNQLQLLESLALHIASAQINASLFAQVQAELVERQQAEEALRESESWLRLAHDAANLGTWQYDLTTNLVHFDVSGREHYGFTQSALPFSTVMAHIHPADHDRLREEFSAVLQYSKQHRIATEYRVLHLNGTVKWLSIQANVYYQDVDGLTLPFLIVGVSRDVTERKQTETEREVLLEIMQGLAITTDLQEFLRLVHKAIAKVIHAENFSVILYHPETELFEEVYAVDEYDPPAAPYHLEKSISAYIFRIGKAARIDQTQFEELVAQGEVELVGTNSPSWLGVPLSTANGVIGVMVVQDYHETDWYTYRDEELLNSVAGQVALAVEQKRAEEALLAREKRFRALIENGADVIATLSPDGTILYESPSVQRVLGYTPEERIGHNAFDYLHPDDLPMLELFAQVIQQPGEAIMGQLRYRHKDGSWRWIESTGTNLLHDPAIRAIVTNYRDVTERKQAREALETNEERFKLALSAAHMGIWQWDVESDHIFWSPECYEIFGVTNFGANRDSFTELVHPEDRTHVMNLFDEALTNHTLYVAEYRIVWADGVIHWVHNLAQGRYNEAGYLKQVTGTVQDITERKQAEIALQEQRQHFRDLFENSPMATWLEDFTAVVAWMDELRPRGITDLRAFLNEHPAELEHALSLIRVVNVNQAAVEQNSAQDKAHLTNNLHLLLGKEAHRDLINELEAIWRGKTRFEFELNGFRLDGTPLVVIIRLDIPLHHNQPDYSRVLITSTEITQLKLAQEALRESEAHYRELADSITDIFVEMDDELRFTSWNKPAEQLSGISAPMAIGKTIVELVGMSPPVQKTISYLHQVLETQNPTTFVLEYPLNDRLYSFDISIYPIRHGLTVLAKDITNQEKARHQLRESEARLGNIVNSAMDAIITVDENQNIVLFNKAAEQIFGCSSAEIIGQPLDRFIPPEFRRKHRQDVRHFGETDLTSRAMGHLGTQMALRANGEHFPIEASISHTQIEEKLLFTIILRDVTERKQMEQALVAEREQLAQRVEERTIDLRRANAELARANRLKDEFLSSMSHELRTPLNAILILSESMQEGVYGDLNEKQVETLHTVIESGQHLLALINDILDLSKIEAGKLELQWSKVNVEQLCAAAVRLTREPALKKKLNFSLTLETSHNAIEADERRLKQVLVNLLSNAVKFTPENGAIGLTVSDAPSGDVIRFIVWDTGIGIDPSFMGKLFRPFVQLDSSLSRRYGGTGLGLALVDRLIKAHGGTVEVESQLNVGSRFTFTLPLESHMMNLDHNAAANSNHPAFTAPRLTHPPTESSPLVLVVDDNPISRDGLIDYLSYEGYQFIVAGNGREALQQARRAKPDVIIMDIQMPEMDGLEVIRRLRALPEFATTPIVALTALAMPGDREKCLEAGASHYITKPIDLKVLVQWMRSVVPA